MSFVPHTHYVVPQTDKKKQKTYDIMIAQHVSLCLFLSVEEVQSLQRHFVLIIPAVDKCRQHPRPQRSEFHASTTHGLT